MTAELFDSAPWRVAPAPPEVDDRTPEQRRRDRQLRLLETGVHPITHRRLHVDAPPPGDRNAPGPRCGTCRFRELFQHHDRRWPKCFYGWDGDYRHDVPYASHGAATDVRAWWPACVAYETREEAAS